MVVELCVVNHPLVDHKLTVLRNKNTEQPVFRRLVEELVRVAMPGAFDLRAGAIVNRAR